MKHRLLCFLFVVSLLLSACSSDVPGPEIPPTPVDRVVIAYMVGDGEPRINTWLLRNVESMRKGASVKALNKGRLIVYQDFEGEIPAVYEITAKGGKKELLKYQYQNSCDPQIFERVLADIKRLAPASEYGLILGSHADGWLPSETNYLNRSVGYDRENRMEIKAFAKAISDNQFEFILFDACQMGCIEAVYELRNKTKYILASPWETPIPGFPYEQAIGKFFYADIKSGLIAASKDLMAYYAVNTNELRPIIAVYDNAKVENLATVARSIFTANANAVANLGLTGIQYYDRNSPHWSYDMLEIVKKVIPSETMLLGEFSAALDEFIVYKDAFDRLNTIPFDKKKYCGIGSYVLRPMDESANKRRHSVYKTLDWYKAVYE